MKYRISFTIGGENFKWEVPQSMSLLDGINRVFEQNISKVNSLNCKYSGQICEMNDAISNIPNDDPDRFIAETEAKSTESRLRELAKLKITSIEIRDGNKTRYL